MSSVADETREVAQVRRICGVAAMFAVAWCVGWVSGAVGMAAWSWWQFQRARRAWR